jgi:hypothetical protein
MLGTAPSMTSLRRESFEITYEMTLIGSRGAGEMTDEKVVTFRPRALNMGLDAMRCLCAAMKIASLAFSTFCLLGFISPELEHAVRVSVVKQVFYSTTPYFARPFAAPTYCRQPTILHLVRTHCQVLVHAIRQPFESAGVEMLDMSWISPFADH